MAGPSIALLMTDGYDDGTLSKGGFTTEFKDVAKRSYGGVPLSLNVYIRLNDGAGGTPSTIIIPTQAPVIPTFGGETVIAVNPITRRREVTFGVVQAGVWQIKLTNNNDWFSGYDVRGSWCALYGQLGTPTSIFAQGKINKIRYETDGTVMIEIYDSMMDIMNYTLTRDMRFQDSVWISDISVDVKEIGSSEYDPAGLTVFDPGFFWDETFILEMTSPTAYKVILEDGDESQTSSISSNLIIEGYFFGREIITIAASGWDSATGAYTTGDRFVFYTSRARSSSELTPIGMVRHLIDDVANISAYDTLNGTVVPEARHDLTNWSDKAAEFALGGFEMSGTWTKGSSIMTMIQDCLKIVHGSIYPAADGTIGLWVLDSGPEVGLELNGDPSAGNVHITSASVDEDFSSAVSEVTFSYLTLDDGVDASVTASTTDSTWLESKPVEVSVGWEVVGAAMQSSAEKYIARFSEPLRMHQLNTTLYGATAEIGDAVLITDSVMGVIAEQSDIVNVSADVVGNSAQIQAYIDPVSSADFFTLDSSVYDGADGYR